MAELSSVKEQLFVLGGYDLEMLEIKAIFEANHIPFLDAQLSWGRLGKTIRRHPTKLLLTRQLKAK